jgi:hypothetical protein
MLFAHARELLILSQHNTTIMRAQRVRKPTAKASIQRLDTPSTVSEAHEAFVSSIESSNEPTPVPAETLSYPLDPLLLLTDAQDTITIEPAILQPSRESTPEDEDDIRLNWTEEMLEQLVDTLRMVYENGGAADNSFKKATFEACVVTVRRAYRGTCPQDIIWSKCKNKWANIKIRWAH